MKTIIYKIKGDDFHFYGAMFDNLEELKKFINFNKDKIIIISGNFYNE